MQAVYRLSKSPASFNFVEFLVAAKTLGATEIVLDDTKGYRKKYSPQETERRMKTIVEPACALAGLPFRYGEAEDGAIDCGYDIKVPLKAYRVKGFIVKLKSVKTPVKCDTTVTIRNQKTHLGRNSNIDAWMRFAEKIGALVIPDYDDKPIHLHDRMALYAGANMNYFVANGPSILCYLSDYPYTSIIPRVENDCLNERHHPGGQFVWRVANQRIIVDNDDWEALARNFPELLS